MAMASEQLHWQIGEVRVSRVIELNALAVPIELMLVDATPALVAPYAWLRPRFVSEAGELMLSFHCFVVEAPGAKIVIDTCIGNDREHSAEVMSNLHTEFMANFRATGIEPEEVDFVFCTHLHFDHVGWNTRREGDRFVPTFPNARYLFDRSELASLQKYVAAEDPHAAHYAAAIAPILEAGLAEFIDAEGYAICDEVRLLPTPGHTPGHASVMISSNGEEAIITGDMIHTPAQCAIPDHHVVADEDKLHGARTRRAFLERFSDTPTLILGTHFPTPTSGWIVKDGDRWQFKS
jgi:glyoxylase-like metal-dependent hydrolase (beta-lactamase superfamily II)